MKIFRNSLWTFFGLNCVAYLWNVAYLILYKIDIFLADLIFKYNFIAITELTRFYIMFVSIGIGFMGTGLTAVIAIKQFKEQRKIEKNIIILLILNILCLPLGSYLLYGMTA